jgi:hypothetical protein
MMRQRPSFGGAAGLKEKPQPSPVDSPAPPAHSAAPPQHVQLMDVMLGRADGGGKFRSQTGVRG